MMDLYPGALPPEINAGSVQDRINFSGTYVGMNFLGYYLNSRVDYRKDVKIELKTYVDQLEAKTPYFISDLGHQFNAAVLSDAQAIGVFDNVDLLASDELPTAAVISALIMKVYPNVDLNFWIYKKPYPSQFTDAVAKSFKKPQRYDPYSHAMLLYGLIPRAVPKKKV